MPSVIELPLDFSSRAALAAAGFAVLEVVEDRGSHRVGEADLDVGVAFFQRDPDPGKGAPCADRADEAVDLAAGLLEDLGPGQVDVALAVGEVVKLVRPDRARRFGLREIFGEASRHVDEVVGVLERNRGDFTQVRAAEAKHVFLFLALGIGDDDHRAVAERVAHEREANSRVARGAFDDGAAGLEVALFFGVEHDRERGAVFHRPAGIHEFGFGEDLAARHVRNAI